mmetsp:Transcript_57006/g.128152  ORF Transcript_57006/g.128152 Transcript_57006/m.128152 type:complete len:1035 (-) Transcript_57006:55-3159(-)
MVAALGGTSNHPLRRRWQKVLLVLVVFIERGGAVRDDAHIDKSQVRVLGEGRFQVTGVRALAETVQHTRRTNREAEVDEAKPRHAETAESRSRRRRRSSVTIVEYGDPRCRCLGWDLHVYNDSGHNDSGHLGRHEGVRGHGVGATCSTWADAADGCDGEVDDSGKPTCQHHWCYVDPCDCDLKNRPHLASAAAGTWLGRRLHYSYATCSGAEPDRARSEFQERPACPLTTSHEVCTRQTAADGTSKCLFVNGECVERTFSADCDAQPDEAVYGKSDCRCVGIGNISGGILYNVSNGTKKLYPASAGSMCHEWDDGTHPDCQASNPLKPSWCGLKWCFVDPCSCSDPGPVRRYPYTNDVTFRGMPLYYSFSTCGEDDEDICSKKPNATFCKKAAGCSWDGTECRDADVLSPQCNASDIKHGHDHTTTAVAARKRESATDALSKADTKIENASARSTSPTPQAPIARTSTTSSPWTSVSTTSQVHPEPEFTVAGGQLLFANLSAPLHEADRQELCSYELQAVHRALDQELARRVKWRNSGSGVGSIANVSALQRAEAKQKEAIKAIEYVWAGHKESGLVALGKIQLALAEISFDRGVLDAPWVFTEGDARTLLQCLGHRAEDEALVEEAGPVMRVKNFTMQLIDGDMAAASSEEHEHVLADMAAGEQWSGGLWTNGEVSYCYAPGVSDRVVKAFERAVAHIAQQASPCVSFNLVPVQSDANASSLRCQVIPAIIVQESREVGAGCWSQVGRSNSGIQRLQLGPGCEFVGVAAHQIMHSLGMLHIQPSPDIFKMHVTQMRLFSDEEDVQPPISEFRLGSMAPRKHNGTTEDLLSLMHSPSFLRSKDWRVALEPQVPSVRRFLGQRYGLSARDAEELRARYGCPASAIESRTAKRQKALLAQAEPNQCWDSREAWIQLPIQSSGQATYFNCSTSKDYCSSADVFVANFTKAMCPLSCGACGSLEGFAPMWEAERQERRVARHAPGKATTAMVAPEREASSAQQDNPALKSGASSRRDQSLLHTLVLSAVVVCLQMLLG